MAPRQTSRRARRPSGAQAEPDARVPREPYLYCDPVADLPVELDAPLAAALATALDPEGKIPRALEALGPVSGRDVLAVGEAGGLRAGQLEELGARLRTVATLADAADLSDQSVDVVVGWWSSFRGVDPDELRLVDRLLRPGGRLLVVHDYGRDDVSRLRGDRPEYSAWSRRDGPFLTGGFRIRVLHCWWTFESVEGMHAFLGDAFGDAGRALAEELKRPRLSYHVAVYHRDRGEGGART